jgi:allantoate deiminase
MGPVATAATRAAAVVQRCRLLAGCSEQPDATTRTFLSAPMREVHAHVMQWMTAAGMTVRVDAAGNIRGLYAAASSAAPRLFIGSHLDTVPRAGAFDGVLGVVLAIALVDALSGRRLPFAIEVVGFSEEEGVRFGLPFIGSRALAGTLDADALARCDAAGVTVADAIRAFGLDPGRIAEARAGDDAVGYLEFHIEQGPVLESRGRQVGVVSAIAGQSRLAFTFTGSANHAGTTPMDVRRDALAAAAEWVVAVEKTAAGTEGLVATVGRLDVEPGAGNVIAGRAVATLDVRHPDDAVRTAAVGAMSEQARDIGTRRSVTVAREVRLDQRSTPMDAHLASVLERAADAAGVPAPRMASGAGHDAMILAPRMPVAMLFVRSPGGVSHHPDEAVHDADVAAALAVGLHALDLLAAERA